jgi:hypothetical protein
MQTYEFRGREKEEEERRAKIRLTESMILSPSDTTVQ